MSKKENYKEMMEKILNHPKFENKNPVDMGLECGYSEMEVKEMIEYAYKVKEKKQPEKVYFIVRSEDTYLVSVDTNSFECQIIKKVPWQNYQINGKILAFIDDKTIKWENVETGEMGEFSATGTIKEIAIVEDGILAYCTVPGCLSYTITKFLYDGEIRTIKSPIDSYLKMMAEDDSGIYLVQNHCSSCRVYRISKDFNKIDEIKEYGDNTCNHIVVAGYDGYEFCYYGHKNDNIYYKAYGKNGDKIEVPWIEKEQVWWNISYGTNTDVEKLLVTDNYTLSGYGIIEGKGKVSPEICPWTTDASKLTQTMAIPSKDVVLGVLKGGVFKLDNIVKIDLKNNSKGYIAIPLKE